MAGEDIGVPLPNINLGFNEKDSMFYDVQTTSGYFQGLRNRYTVNTANETVLVSSGFTNGWHDSNNDYHPATKLMSGMINMFEAFFQSRVGEAVDIISTGQENYIISGKDMYEYRKLDGSVLSVADYPLLAKKHSNWLTPNGLNITLPDMRDKVFKYKDDTTAIGTLGGRDSINIDWEHSHANTVSDNIWFKMTGSAIIDDAENTGGAFSHSVHDTNGDNGSGQNRTNFTLDTGDAEGHEHGGTNSKGTTKSGRVSIVNATSGSTPSATQNIENSYYVTRKYIITKINKAMVRAYIEENF